MPDQAHPGFAAPPAAGGDSEVRVKASELQAFRTDQAALAELRSAHERLQAEFDQHRSFAQSQADELAKARESAAGISQQWTADRQAWEAKVAASTSAADSLRTRMLEQAKSAAIAAATAGCEWSGDSPETRAKVAARFGRELSEGLEAKFDEAGNVIVAERATGRPVHEVVKAALSDSANQIYLAPKSRGGSGTDGTGSIHGINSYGGTDGNGHRPGSVEWHGQLYRDSQRDMTGLVVRPRNG